MPQSERQKKKRKKKEENGDKNKLKQIKGVTRQHERMLIKHEQHIT